MKKLIFILAIGFCQFSALTSLAQAPQAIPYQGVARNATGNIIASQPVSLRVSIHDGTAAGTVVYSETHSPTTTALGLFNVNVGEGTVISGTLAGVNWGGGAKFMQVEMDATGGNSYADMGTTQLNSVPYALFAGGSNDWTRSGNDIYNSNTGNVGIGTTTPSSKLHVVGGDANLNGVTISPTNGCNSIAIGQGALSVNNSCENVAIGVFAAIGIDGPGNTVVGRVALGGNGISSSSSYNSAVGYSALTYSSGNNNTGIGSGAGNGINGSGIVTGDNNTYLGAGTYSSNATITNATAIGANTVVDQSNSLVLGNNANVGIGTSAPDSKLHVVGNIKMVDGNEAAGKILTSDASGVASWQTGAAEVDPKVSNTITNQVAKWNGTTLVDGMITDDGTNVGIGTLTPLSKLHTEGGSVLFNGITGATPTSGAGSRFMWIPGKSALRAGSVSNTQWDDNLVGQSSVAFGENNIAANIASMAYGENNNVTGRSAISGGQGNTASGDLSMALGLGTTASGWGATSLGVNTNASGNFSLAMGSYSTSSGQHSAAFGQSTASGLMSAAFGQDNEAAGWASLVAGYDVHAIGIASVSMGAASHSYGATSVTLGNSANAYGDNSLAVGGSSYAMGNGSVAIGPGANAQSYGEIALGSNNTTYTPQSTTLWDPADRLLTIGNGSGGGNTSDAMTVLKNGKIGMGTSSPATKLDIVGNVKITDGTEGTGKVLTSDANGVASWQSTSGLQGPIGPQGPQGVPGNDGATGPQGPAGLLSSGATAGNTAYWNGTSWVTNSSNIFNNGNNVGIGTETPSDKLHITTSGQGNASKTFALRLENDDFGSTGTGIAFSTEGGSLNYAKAGIMFERTDIFAKGKLHFLQSNANTTNDVQLSESVMTIDPAGNVGIGTSSPDTKLHVVGSIKMIDGNQASGKVLTSDANGAASWQLISGLQGPIGPQGPQGIPGNDGATGPQGPAGVLSSGTTAGNTPYWNGSSWIINNSNIYNNGGNVGIGTTTPLASSKATIVKSQGNALTLLSGDTHYTSMGIGRTSSEITMGIAEATNNFLTGTVSGDAVLRVDNNANKIVVGAGVGTAATMVVTGTNVGIGQTSPVAPLHVTSSNTDGHIRFNAPQVNCTMGTDGAEDMWFNNATTSNPGGKTMSFKMNGDTKIMIRGNGNVGIGTTSASSITQRLTVFNGTSTGTYTTSGWIHSSDGRLKTNIQPLKSSLSKILQLNAVSYNWKNSPVADRQVGFVAQDVQKVFPEVVVVDEAGNYGMAYQNLVAPMVEAMKEQQQQIEAQQKQIEELNRRLEKLEKKQ